MPELRQKESLLPGQQRVLEMIARGAPLPQTLRALAILIEQQCPRILCSILLVDETRNSLLCGAAPSFPEDYNRAIDGMAIGPDAGTCAVAAYSGKRAITTDIANDPGWATFRDLALRHGLQACWSDPIFSTAGTVLGTFAIYRRELGGPAPEHLRLIETATHLAAIAIERTRADEALRRAHAELEQRARRQTAQLALSEARWQLALDAAQMYAWEWNIRTDELRTSGYAPLAAFSGRLVTFQDFLNLVQPQDRENVRRAVADAIAGKGEYRVEFRIRRDDGSISLIESRGRAFFDEDHKATHLIGVGVDITERMRAEEALRQSEERFAAFMRNLPGAAFLKDVDGKYVYVNQWLEMVYGKSSSEWIGKCDHELWPAETAAQFKANDRLIFETGRSLKVLEAAQYGGELHHLLIQKFPVLDRTGRPILLAGVAIDITERKRAEEKLALRARQQAAVAELGQRALKGGDLSALRAEAAAVAAATLGLPHCGVWDLRPDALEEPARRAPQAGPETPAAPASLARFALSQPEQPVIFEDLARERRFEPPARWLHAGIVSGVAVLIIAGRDGPVGLFGALARAPRTFSPDEVHFLQAVANIVATALQRQGFEKQILEISEREQLRIGQDLHDGLCQRLAGIALACDFVHQSLQGPAPAAGAEAARIARQIRETLWQTSLLARGLSPVGLEANGLCSALEELAGSVRELFRVECQFRCARPVGLADNAVAVHLYRIAQEAIHNAIKHGKSRRIVLELAGRGGRLSLSVADDGRGMPAPGPLAAGAGAAGGMGLRIMKSRAELIGATLRIGPNHPSGTIVTCELKSVTGDW
jgi:PAS domain S-box-containing protein